MSVEVTPLEAQLAQRQGAVMIDVREQEERDGVFPPDSLHIPTSQFMERLEDVPIDSQVVVICAHGVRSLAAANVLRSQGIDAVSVSGGLSAWAADGLPISSS